MTCDKCQGQLRPVKIPPVPAELKLLPQWATHKKVAYHCPGCGLRVVADAYQFNHKAGMPHHMN